MLENIQEIQHAAIKNDCYPQKIKDELSHYNVKNENDKLWDSHITDIRKIYEEWRH